MGEAPRGRTTHVCARTWIRAGMGKTELEEEPRRGGGAKKRWRSQEEVEEPRSGGGTKKWWRNQEVVEEPRSGGGAKKWWRSQEVVEVCP
ncbi:hypothetical protein PVT01_130022700 [Plasmodium vivax]|uniref:Uncharacterized protein n=1 Tax=Plasmodium vivax TaxID=5855 RepID=A0A1G4H351_PLAVI|nr:hypothetical protein PVT01_130022700 [Plasmodium vivax]